MAKKGWAKKVKDKSARSRTTTAQRGVLVAPVHAFRRLLARPHVVVHCFGRYVGSDGVGCPEEFETQRVR